MADIELPWPPRELSPNYRSRSHWPRTRALKKAKQWAHIATLARDNGTEPPEGTIPLLLTFYPPTAHQRDRDNLLASCKPYLDGIAQAWGVDDSRFDPRVQIAEPTKNSKVVITIIEGAA